VVVSNHDPYSDFVPSLLVEHRKVYSVRCEADGRYDITHRILHQLRRFPNRIASGWADDKPANITMRGIPRETDASV